MSRVSTNNQHYSNIASAIRAKLDVATTYTPSEMAAAILSITGRCPHADVVCAYTLTDLPMTFTVTAVEEED